MTKMQPRVAIITLNWNGAEDTKTCVRSLLRLEYVNFEVVICDNASRPESWQSLLDLQKEFPGQFRSFDSLAAALTSERGGSKISLIQTGGNLGYAGGMNVGMRYALADPTVEYCWVLNNDTEVDAQALQALLDRVDKGPEIGICGSSLVLYHDRDRLQAFGGCSYQPARARSAALGIGARRADIPTDPSEIEARMAYVIGASMLVPRRFVEEVGLMDERYFLYSEEHDWAQRGRGRFRLGYAPRSIVYHKHGATIGTSASGGSTLSLFYLFRNKLAFTRRHYPLMLPLAASSLCVDALKFLAKGQPAKCWAALRGLLAFRRMSSF